MFRLDKIARGVKNMTQDRRFWRKIGLTLAADIRERTETEKVDFRGKPFKRYAKNYAAFRAEKGRSTKPNLSFTGNMLGAMGRGVRPRGSGVKLILSGEEGGKAAANQKKGRVFFRTSNEQRKDIKTAFLRHLRKQVSKL